MGGISRRQFGTGGMAAAVTALAPRQLWAKPFISASVLEGVDPLGAVHPQLRPAIAAMRGAKMTLTDATLAQMRMHIPAPPPADPSVPVAAQRISGAAGQPPVTVYVINQREGSGRPAILHVHGGGYILGRAQQEIARLQRIATDLNCVIVTVEYRLAPEARWRESLADNYAGLKWLHDQAETLGVDRSRIAVMGESAGGGHAALLAQAATRLGEVPLVFQALVYPMLDDRTGSTRAMPRHIGAFGWDAASNRFGWASLLGREPGGASVEGVPGRTLSLKGLPPAFIGVGSVDLFVDEDVDYARRLITAGVPTELCVVPGGFHGFDFVDVPVAHRFNAAKLNALRTAFNEPWRTKS